MNTIRITVSGSFHRHMREISQAVREIVELGCEVLSPREPEVVDSRGRFLFVASDMSRQIKVVQSRHFECIGASHFLWLVCPDGYIGASAAAEIGYAVANQIPIFSTSVPHDDTLCEYVSTISSLSQALNAAKNIEGSIQPITFLIDTKSASDEIIRSAVLMNDIATGKIQPLHENALFEHRAKILRILGKGKEF